MNKKTLLITLSIILAIILLVVKNNMSVKIGPDITFNEVYQTHYKTMSTCTSVNNYATIHCNCNIVVNDVNHKIDNTINAISCDGSSDLCSNLCSKFSDELAKK